MRALLFLTWLWPCSAFSASAKDAPAATEADDDEQATKPPDPTGKLYDKFEMQRGFYIASDLGALVVFGGASRAVSNLQPYIGISVGYDFSSWLSWQVHVGRGFAADAARTANESNGGVTDFSFTNFTTGPVVWLRVWERLAVEIKLQGGFATLDPIPVTAATDGLNVAGTEPLVGGGLALKYLTLLTDFTLGLDATFNYIIPIKTPCLSLSPTVRYTF